MDKPIKMLDHKTKGYLKEVDLETPSSEFASQVMDRIIAVQVSKTPYQPLISLGGWWVVATVVMSSVALLYFFPIDTWDQFSFDDLFAIRFDTSWSQAWNPSNTLLYGVFFTGLFLLQIPFLKRLVDKNIEKFL